MSLEKLLDKIEEDAREQGERIVSEANTVVERIKAKGEEDAHDAAQAIRDSFLERAQRERVKISSEALSQSRGTLLSAQENLYEDIVEEALKIFRDIPEERYCVWLKRMIMKGTTSGDEDIFAAQYDRRLLEEGLLNEINQALRSEGRSGSLGLSEEQAGFDRGVILRGDRIENNLILETISRNVRDMYEGELLKTLFGEGITKK
jgi:vacuolar-type H+-ATPase subunit E/Vma4